MDPIDEIKQIYFKATAQSIERDFARAIDLLKTLPDEDARGRAAVFMEGLAEMRKDWERRQKGAGKSSGSGGAKTRGPRGKRNAARTPKPAKQD
jgi:hypothetical protein